MTTKLEQAEAVKEQAEEALKAQWQAKTDWIEAQDEARVRPLEEAVSAAKENVREEAGEKFDATIQTHRAALEEANKNYLLATIDSQGDGPMAAGTKLVKWEMPRYAYHSERTYRLTGDVGMIEYWGPGSVAPNNLANYSLPSLGTLVVRLLKKDGSPSAKFDKGYRVFPAENDPYRNLPSGWYPEGVDPNKLKEKA